MKKLVRLTGIYLVLVLMFSCSTRDEFLQEDNADLQLKSAQVAPGNGNRYIVVFRDNVTDPEAVTEQLKGKHGFAKGHVYNRVFKGFSAVIPAQALEGLRNNPNVAYIEPDLIMTAFAQTVPTGIKRMAANTNTVVPVDGNPDLPDVDVAVVDTGVDKEHADLTVSGGVRFYNAGKTDGSYDDNNGHGSHVAGTIGAIDNSEGVVGVCPGARIWAVKVLDSSGSGYTSDIIAGLNWVRNRGDIEVINMSLGGTGTSTSYRTAVQNCVNAGIVVVVAAGNSKADVYGKDGKFGTSDDYIPASYPEAMTISALADTDGLPGGLGSSTSYGADDSWATFSNFSKSVTATNPVNSPGKAIDLILPGVNIYSCYMNANYATMSGTSMASPHAAGLVALYIVKNGKPANAAGVYALRQALIDGGKLQTDPAYGLKTQNDPDGNKENLGWADLAGGTTDRPPVANAGPDQVIKVAAGGSASVTLDGAASTDDHGIVSWVWTEGSTILGSGKTITVDLTQGTHTVVLTVTDTNGQTDTDEVVINLTENAEPKADFTFTTSGLTVNFTDTSSDTDGTIASRNWNFGDGGTSTSQNPSHAYGAAGSYTVGLTVTDNNGATGTVSKNVTVTVPSNLVLTYTASNYWFYYRVTLSWSGGTGPYKVLRNGSQIATNLTGTSYVNNLTRRGTYTYQVCKTDGTLCSNVVTVTY